MLVRIPYTKHQKQLMFIPNTSNGYVCMCDAAVHTLLGVCLDACDYVLVSFRCFHSPIPGSRVWE